MSELRLTYCNKIDRVIAQAKLRELKCIMAVFKCDARTIAKTVMASNECEMYSQYNIYKGLMLCSSVCGLVDLTCAVKLNARRQVIKPLAVGLFE